VRTKFYIPPLLLAAVVVAVGGGDARATFPGTNGLIGFERWNKEDIDLFAAQPDGSGESNVDVSVGKGGEIAYSPDGSRIAFTRAAGDDGPYEIYTANADGSNTKRLTRHKRFSISAAWSPDGERLVYVTQAGKGEDAPLRLHVINADGTGNRQLGGGRRPGTPEPSDPRWTPDGEHIVYSQVVAKSEDDYDFSLVIVDADDGGDLRQITPKGGADEVNPNVSPDGTSVVYEVSRRFNEKQSDIALVSIDGGDSRRLTSTPVHEIQPVWSPDGTLIAFASDRDNRKLSNERFGRGFEIYTMASGGGDIRRLTRNKQTDALPDWQPLPSGG
jgi:Tol biopolymer transport system component